MQCIVGRVIADQTRLGINPNTNYKYHLCVCGQNKLFLFINSRHYPEDFPLPKAECTGLRNPESYISVWRVLHIPSFTNSVRLIGSVSPAYLRALIDHVRTCTVARDAEKKQIIGGIERHLGI